ncbi:MAG: ribosome maturation factor RimM [Cyclobacteriaceae bacterium]
MDIDSCYRVGYVTKRHGLKGEVKIHLETSLPNEKLESIFLEQNQRLIPFFIEGISTHADTGIFKLEDIDTPEQADSILRCHAYLPKSLFKEEESPGPAMTDLIGFEVWFHNQLIGEVTEINDFALNPLLIVKNGEKEVLIPFGAQFVKEIRDTEKKVLVDLPDGFLDI